ncbi:hypothetical protein [Streptococcus mutans]|nr:hypothetical protein [Streptococcus mutans]EMC21676.1 sugar phosphate sensor protein [Streptococcus mutans SF14]
METYVLVDNVKSLPHSLTPHDFILDNERLCYQTFTSMKDCRIVFPLIKE